MDNKKLLYLGILIFFLYYFKRDVKMKPLKINSGFKPKNRPNHNGVDFAALKGTKIILKTPGKVLRTYTQCTEGAKKCGGGYGNFIEIQHNPDVNTIYAHLSKINVTPGQYINEGQIIGETGNTGNSFGAHLHWEYKLKGVKSNGTSLASNFFGLV